MKDETTGPNLPGPLREGPGRPSGRSRSSVRQHKPKKRALAFRWLLTVGLLLLFVLVVRPFVPPDARMPPMVYAALIVLLGLGGWYEFKVLFGDGRKRPKK